VLKLARSGEDADKVLLLIESGTRFHTVQAMPEKADTPSNFTLKLRKHIRYGLGWQATIWMSSELHVNKLYCLAHRAPNPPCLPAGLGVWRR
jgi:hypothetical protein